MQSDIYIQRTKQWIEQFVIGKTLCPFAKNVWINQQIRYVVSEATTEVELLELLIIELQQLAKIPAKKTDTTLVIHPHLLTDFYDYNDFLYLAEEAIERLGYEGVFQLASFHPDYQFEGTVPEDAENYTNKSPYPMLHILREESVEKAIAHFPNPENIPIRNVETLNDIGSERLKEEWNTI